MVDDEYAESFKNHFNLFEYLRISSKTGENVQKAFELLTRMILKRQNY